MEMAALPGVGIYGGLAGSITSMLADDDIVGTPQNSGIPQGKDDKCWDKSNTPLLFVIGIIISIIIFVVIISIYDVIKERLIVSYTDELSYSPFIAETAEKALKMRLESEASLNLSMAFSLIAIFIAIALLPMLFLAYYKVASN